MTTTLKTLTLLRDEEPSHDGVRLVAVSLSGQALRDYAQRMENDLADPAEREPRRLEWEPNPLGELVAETGAGRYVVGDVDVVYSTEPAEPAGETDAGLEDDLRLIRKFDA